jgi:hypothetical protein
VNRRGLSTRLLGRYLGDVSVAPETLDLHIPEVVRYVKNVLAQPERFPDAPNSSTLSVSTQEGIR